MITCTDSLKLTVNNWVQNLVSIKMKVSVHCRTGPWPALQFEAYQSDSAQDTDLKIRTRMELRDMLFFF